ncbi:titin homolog [Ischnura elegans]|uniref:titin homolog n=1 Tax=Ischnura elegans TaxID=197161 RepID=UPI001ED8948D|nr:titin homolog [Ischnura elegans]
MVINRSDAKKRKKEGEMLQNSLPESPKRTKVHAQRKFAQGSSLSSPTMTPVKDKDKSKSNGSVSSSELIPSKRPKTEDFLTFLCLRGTPILPPRLDFFNLASVPDGQEDEQVPVQEVTKDSARSKTVPTHSNSRPASNPMPPPKSSPKLSAKATEKKTDACDLPTSGTSRRSERSESKDSTLRSGHSINKRPTTAVQALKKKYQEQRLAKQRGSSLSKLAQIVKEKSMMRTRSSAVSESIHLTTRSQPVVKLEKLSKSKILKKISGKSVTPPKKESAPKKAVSRNASSNKRVTRSIIPSKESPPKASKSSSTPNSAVKSSPKVEVSNPKRGSLRSRGSLPLSEEESNLSKRRSVSRPTPVGDKQQTKPQKRDSTKLATGKAQEKKSHGSKSTKGGGKEFASSLSDFSSDDDQPLIRKTTKMSIQNVRRTKLVKKALKRIVMKNKKPMRMITRSQQHRSGVTTSRRISHRPTRKTKEAAAVFMELIGKKWTSPEEDTGEDDLVALEDFPDVRKFNKSGKTENENKAKTSGESSRKETTSLREKNKPALKVDISTRRVSDSAKEGNQDVKAKKNIRERAEPSKSNSGKDKKRTLSHKERILREKMRRNAGKVICNKTAHSKCITGAATGKKGISKPKSEISHVQTRNRSLRSDSSDDVSKKQPNSGKLVVVDDVEDKMKLNRTTRLSTKGSDEPKTSTPPKIAVENKEESKTKQSDGVNVSVHPLRASRKSASRTDAVHQLHNSSQFEDKFSDSDEEPLGRKVVKNLRQSIGVSKSLPDSKEASEKSKLIAVKEEDKIKESSKKAEEKLKHPVKKKDDIHRDKKVSDKSKDSKKTIEKLKDFGKKSDGKTLDDVKTSDDKSKEVNVRGESKIKDEKSKEVNVKGDSKIKDDRSKEVNVKGDSKIKDDRSKEIDVKGESKIKDDRSKEVKGENRSKEFNVKGENKSNDDRSKEFNVKSDRKSKGFGKKSSDKSKEGLKKKSDKKKNKKNITKKVDETSREVIVRKSDDKAKETHRRASHSSSKKAESVDSEIHEISTRARSLKISAPEGDSPKIAKPVAIENEKAVKLPVLKDAEPPKVNESPHNVLLKKAESSAVGDDVLKRITRNEKTSKTTDLPGNATTDLPSKVEEKPQRKKSVDESGNVSTPKGSGVVKCKAKEVSVSEISKDAILNIPKLDGKRPLESSERVPGQSDSKKFKCNVTADSASKASSNQMSKLNESLDNSVKTESKSPDLEKFSAVGSNVDEALQSMKKDAACSLISDTEVPVELAKVETGVKKKLSSATHQPKKEPTKHPPSKKSISTPEMGVKHRQPVEIRCDKMCEKSKLFSIEKQAHGGLVLVKKVPSSELIDGVSPSSKAPESKSLESSPVDVAVKKTEAIATGSFSSLNIPKVPLISIPGVFTCSCKSWVTIPGKLTPATSSSCPIHGEGTSLSHTVISEEQKAKDVDSPSKDSKKCLEEGMNAESVHNTSVFGTDVDSVNDIECADNEVRRKVSKTVEEIEKWLLVSERTVVEEEKHEDSDLQANKIEFDNIRESMLTDVDVGRVTIEDSVADRKPQVSSQVSSTLESVEKGIGIPLQTFYNRGMHKGLPKIPDPYGSKTNKFREDRTLSLSNSAHLASKLVQRRDVIPLKNDKPSIKPKVDAVGPSEKTPVIAELLSKVEDNVVKEPSSSVPSQSSKASSPPSKPKVETKKSPTKSKIGGIVSGLKKTSSLRNFRMKHDAKMKAIVDEPVVLPPKSSKSPSPTAVSPGKVTQQVLKSPSNESSQIFLLNSSSSSDEIALSVIKSEVLKNQRSPGEHGMMTSTPEKKPIILKGGNNFTVRKPKECLIRRTPSVGAFSPENESSVYAFETEDREATPISTPFRRKTKDGGTNTSPDKLHHRHSSSSSESSSFVCSEVGSPGAKSVSAGIAHISKSFTPDSPVCGGGNDNVIKNPTCTTSIAVQVNLDESLTRNTKSPPISVPIYIPSTSKDIGLSTSSPTPVVILPEMRSTECSTQTDNSDANDKGQSITVETSTSQKQTHATSEGHLFYIPLRPTPMVNQTAIIGSPTTSISSNQLIRGVTVKLGTEGPTGPNQRVIMHAELVTDPPQFAPTIHCQAGTLTSGATTFSSELPDVKGATFVAGPSRSSVQHIHPAVVSLPSDQKHMCHSSLLPISVVSPASQPLLTQQQSPLSRPSVPPPVGTVQPTTRPRPVASVDGTAGKGPTLCVTSTQTDNEKVDTVWPSSNTTTKETTTTTKPTKATAKSKESADHSAAGPSSSKASTSKRSQPKAKGRASLSSANESEGSSSVMGGSSSSVPLTNHPNPIATFPNAGSPRMVEAPTFYPTEKEFQDPMEFIERIRPIAEKFGLCRVVPPTNFKPDCQVSDDMRFTAYNQYVHKMLHRWGPNVKEMMVIKKYLRTQSISFTHPPWIGGMEIDLPRLYQTVQSFGGLKEVIEKKKWQRVADGMRIPKLAQDRVTKLDDIYCKYLLPYDTLSPDERQKLFDDIEKEWGDRENQPLNLEGQSNDDDSEGDGSDEFDECIVKGRSMALNAFYRIARNTMATWFKQPEPSATDVETEYWRHVTGRNHHVCVHSGSIDSSVWGYGFPCTKGSPLARHPWNLKVFTNNSGSILRSMGPVMGVTVPTLHVGMLFTTCCWYRDPHGLPWVEYLHTGASKIWYGIPHSQSDSFCAAMTKLVPRYCKNKTIWLPSDTAMVPPNLLVKNGVSLCRTVQEPGQFILVFPRAFTSSICAGYLVSESVYFSQPGWLSTAEEVFKDIKDSCEPSMFSLERFLFRVATDPKSHVDVLKQVLPMIFRIRENELEKRKQLLSLGLKSCERLPQQPVKRNRKGPRSARDDDGDYECEICRANLYISLVTDSNEECVYCLQHAVELLTKKKNHVKYCKLMYTYDQAELNDMIQKLLEKIETKTQKKSQSKHGAVSR